MVSSRGVFAKEQEEVFISEAAAVNGNLEGRRAARIHDTLGCAALDERARDCKQSVQTRFR